MTLLLGFDKDFDKITKRSGRPLSPPDAERAQGEKLVAKSEAGPTFASMLDLYHQQSTIIALLTDIRALLTTIAEDSAPRAGSGQDDVA